MSPSKIGLFAAAIAVISAVSWQYHGHQSRREEMARLRADNDGLRSPGGHKSIVPPVRAEVSGAANKLTASSAEESLRSTGTAPRGTSAETTTLVAPSPYRNEGTATPLNALQTLAWACDRADMALMEKVLIYDDDARERAERYFAAHPTKMPADWVSLEAAAAALYIADGIKHPYPTAKILALATFEQISPSRVRLHLPGANGDGYEFQQTVGGWKLAVTLKIVDEYIREASLK